MRLMASESSTMRMCMGYLVPALPWERHADAKPAHRRVAELEQGSLPRRDLGAHVDGDAARPPVGARLELELRERPPRRRGKGRARVIDGHPCADLAPLPLAGRRDGDHHLLLARRRRDRLADELADEDG